MKTVAEMAYETIELLPGFDRWDIDSVTGSLSAIFNSGRSRGGESLLTVLEGRNEIAVKLDFGAGDDQFEVCELLIADLIKRVDERPKGYEVKIRHNPKVSARQVYYP